MKTLYDVQAFLRRFGTYVYFGDRKAELEFMLGELIELYADEMMTREDFLTATMLVKKELAAISK
ncbi:MULTISPECIES: YqgQ family protein [Bacillus]|uniref:Cytosolic protein n=2 Tax=Bacillus TaxID=1386 RepID=A0A0M3R9L3_9BACI|nr:MULTISPECIES: YqgQ family protein [Bacillus]ALC81626.1 hypothetical protein AM592_08420 [Bacillus gobiensis]MBP1080668.1 uncharacterized protein YqgQ [Bacillus capparidis]MED1094524.1 YqgQ family protein [Bacillus capparidis]